ncbi:hypothetical protein GCM10020331_093620 [Ectobacillus funiculus]
MEIPYTAPIQKKYGKDNIKKQWAEEFPKLEVSIKPHVLIVRIGLSSKSQEMKE